MKKLLFFIFILLSVITGTSVARAKEMPGNRPGVTHDLVPFELPDAKSAPDDDTAYSFIVAGHAYGAHEGGNIGLHPALLNSLSSGFDSTVAFFVFTGDIVNYSTSESWQQVENELSGYGLPWYFVMGNHDNNDIGRQVFEEKYGGTYYAFYSQSDLFIVLNSPEADRSISPDQLDFLQEQIGQAGESTRNIYIFFHEVLWNSHEKYIGVRSNSRSRYDQIVNYSNYWEEVHPMLTGNPGKQFYVIAGDVGGNPDAVAAFYDKWDNVTLLASGMGEVPDENYLLIKVHSTGSVGFNLVPLNAELSIPDIEFYSVPAAPGTITGPDEVSPGSMGIEYAVPEVFNATSYLWELPAGLTGSSISNHLSADVDPGFTGGIISVKAERDGFGRGPASSKMIKANVTSVNITEAEPGSQQIKFLQTVDHLIIGINRLDGEVITVRIFDTLGRLLKQERFVVKGDDFEWRIDNTELSGGLLLISVSVQNHRMTRKFILSR